MWCALSPCVRVPCVVSACGTPTPLPPHHPGGGVDDVGSPAAGSSSPALPMSQARCVRVVRTLLQNFVRHLEAPAATASVLAHYIGPAHSKEKEEAGTPSATGVLGLVGTAACA